MPVVFFLLVLSYGLEADTIAPREAPAYSGASIVNAADNLVEPLAPNTIATIYGKNLAYGTKSLTLNDVSRGVLPTALPGSGVRIIVGGFLANPYYVSPTQINFLVPPNLRPGASDVEIDIDGLAGPSISVQLAAAAPALFQLDTRNAVATRAGGTPITPAAPAKPGEVVVLYATGLGQTTPPIGYCELPWSAAWIKQAADFRVVLDGVPLAQSAILYAGVAPGFAGLYQVNVILPPTTGVNPEVRIGFTETLSMPGVRLPVQP
jgi:uncharacterized protein (TIGR03437 family)